MNTLTLNIASSCKEASNYQEAIENSCFPHMPYMDYETDYVMFNIAQSLAESDVELYISSRHLFDIVRIAIGEGHIPVSNVKVFFGIDNPEEVTLQSNGSVVNWPPAMFEVESRRARRLADCRRVRL